MAAPAVAVSGLTVRYGTLTAVADLSFEVAAGEVVALLGPNGAGKTTTVEVLEGYRRPTAGSARVLGLDPVADHAALVPRIGVMLQGGGVYPGIRALEAVRLFASYAAAPEDPVALLERVGLADRARTTWRHLSGGEQRRLSLALALVGRPEVAFLDEPTAGVDVSGRQLVRSIVRELRTRGTTVLVTTHDLEDAERVADRVLIVDRGRLLAAGTPDELTTGAADADVRFGAPAGLDTGALAAAVAAPVEELSPGEYRVAGDPSPATVAAVTAWLAEHDVPLADLRAGRHRLEDVFLQLTAPEDDGGGADARRAGRRGRRGRR